tara:strand:- start:601 stop:804 length:204 start_codon:yes stop_codon:yes gene_type:complete
MSWSVISVNASSPAEAVRKAVRLLKHGITQGTTEMGPHDFECPTVYDTEGNRWSVDDDLDWMDSEEK